MSAQIEPPEWDEDLDYEEHPGPGETRCVECGEICDIRDVETIDDCYLGQCKWCTRPQP